jgi:hypothetical protein
MSGAGRSKSPSARCATTSGSRPSASGRTARSTPVCSRCSRSSPCSPLVPLPKHAGRSRPPPGIASHSPPSPIPSPPVRRQFWQEQGFFTSYPTAEAQKSQPALHEAIAYTLCHAA